MDELALIRASQSGDRTAFGELVDRYYKNIYRIAFSYTGSHEEADDACQETFLRAFGSINELKNGSRFQNWIYMIAANLLRKRIRVISREKHNRNNADYVAGLASRSKAEPYQRISDKERAGLIHLQLQQMPQRLRLTTILILMQGINQKDAAGILNCSEASVSRELEMAKKWLRSRLRGLL